MRTLRITVAYDGSAFSGWQVQPGRETVQGLIESALSAIEGGRVRVAGSGRTDAGVHALGQTASFTLNNPIPAANLKKALNRILPPAVRICAAAEAPPGFHAGRSACAKTYEYRIHRGETCPPFVSPFAYWYPPPLDEEAMFAAAPLFEGTRDFRSVASRARPPRRGEPEQSTVRTIFSSRFSRRGDLLVYRVRGSGFLYRMVRNVVGTLLEVGRGKRRPADVPALLAACDRSLAGATAPARGLFLAEVEYAER